MFCQPLKPTTNREGTKLMANKALNITPETNADDLVVLDRKQLVMFAKQLQHLNTMMNHLKQTADLLGIPDWDLDRNNTVKAYAEQLKVIKTDE
jgi:hypothetical protein